MDLLTDWMMVILQNTLNDAVYYFLLTFFPKSGIPLLCINQCTQLSLLQSLSSKVIQLKDHNFSLKLK
jgi:hypothetical protein